MNRLFLILIIFCFSCSKKLKIQEPVKEHEAKMADIILPVNFFSIKSSDSSIEYLTKIDMQELVKYYQENLEIYGWKSVVEFIKDNNVLIYEKPHKFLSIIIMPIKQDISKVIIYTQQKFSDEIN